MPTPRRCSGCGAALGDPTDDDLTIVCRFCGLRHDINDLAAEATPIVVQVGSPRTGGAARAIATIVLRRGAGGRGQSYIANRARNDVTSACARPQTRCVQRVADWNRRCVTELGTLTECVEGRGHGAAAGRLRGFDPAALPWGCRSRTPGRRRSADAHRRGPRVVHRGGSRRRHAERLPFPFAGAAAALEAGSDGGIESTTASGMMLQVQGTTVRVLMETSAREEPATPAPASLRLPDLLTKARTARGFSDRPFYAAYMIFLPREGWAWYFRAPSGDSFPRVRARDGRVYPY
jgi:hypothetical protein